MDIQENVLRHVPQDPGHDGPAPDGPVHDGPVQILGPGFAPFKPYLRPRFFYIRVSGPILSACIHTHLHCDVHWYCAIHWFNLQVLGFLIFTATVAITGSILSLTLPGAHSTHSLHVLMLSTLNVSVYIYSVLCTLSYLQSQLVVC